MRPRPRDIARLCAHWLRPPDGKAAAEERARTALAALCELLGATGAGLAVADGSGFLSTGDLRAEGSAELADGPTGQVQLPDGALVRARASVGERWATLVLRFAAERAPDGVEGLVEEAMGELARFAGEWLVPARREDRFGDYILLGPLDSGGMAQLDLARRADGPEVALKRIRRHLADDPVFLGLFTREVQAIARVDDPNVVRILEYGIAEGQAYLTMELLRGASLERLWGRVHAGSPPSLSSILAWTLDWARGLEAVHRAGLVHCDISPQNLFLTLDGSGVLIDFGVARLRADRPTSAPEEGPHRGKAGYMAPEQRLGGEVDPRTDLFALCAVAAELLGLRRLRGRTLGPPLVRRIPAGVAEVLSAGLSTRPQERPASAAALRAGLLEAARAGGVTPSGRRRLAAEVRDAVGDWIAGAQHPPGRIEETDPTRRLE